MERVALVTGGGGGIGRAVARALADQGRAVVVADVRLDAAEETAREVGGRAMQVDVGAPGGIPDLGQVDIAVNAAGWDELRPFLETDEPFWERVLQINLLGTVRITHAVVAGMVERGFGRLINIGSDAGRVGSSHEAVYSGAKGGVIAFTKTIAREVARAGVTANTVCPGPTRTPMLETMAAEGGEKLIDALVRAVPMRRLAEPEDVAAAVAFFASEAAGYVTGQTLSVSGGLTMA